MTTTTATAAGPTRHVLLSSGSNARGQLANRTLEDSHHFQQCSFHGQPPGILPHHATRIVDIAAGANNTLLLLEVVSSNADKEVYELWGCGDGSSGQLGLAYSQEVKKRAEDDPWSTVFQRLDLGLEQAGLDGYYPMLIAASWETTYVALRSSQEGGSDMVISMGSNDFGDLGIGVLDKTKGKGKKKAQPFYVVEFNHLFSKTTKRMDVVSLNAGQHHVVVELEVDRKERHLVGWGAARHGQVGNLVDKAGKPIPFAPLPVVIPIELTRDPIRSVSLGMQHTAALHYSGRITSIGSNRKAQLNGLNSITNAVILGCTWNGTYVCTQDGINMQVLSTGSSQHGQLGRLLESTDVISMKKVDWELLPGTQVRLACGTEHVLAQVHSTNSDVPAVWGWGWNEHGNLGTGSTEDVPTPCLIWPATQKEVDEVREVHGIWAGCGTSWIYAAFAS